MKPPITFSNFFGSLMLIAIVSISVAHSAEYSYNFGFGKAGEFAVIEGQPVLARWGDSIQRDWTESRIYIQKDGSLIHLETKKPLSYPLEGDDPKVVLGAEKGTSDKWKFSFGPKDDGESVVRVAEGKFKGWYLDWDNKEHEVAVDGKSYYVRSLKLVESPATKRKFIKWRDKK
jgi:hypothetical protein